MDYIFWLIIGLVLMAIELVIPGGIACLHRSQNILPQHRPI